MASIVNKLASHAMPIYDEARGCLRICISEEVPDADDEVVVPSTIRLERYASNPVVLFGHDQGKMPVGKSESPDGQFTTVLEDGKLMAEWYFANTAEGRDAAHLYSQRFLRGASIGFKPDGIEDLSPDVAEQLYGVRKPLRRYTGGELLEVSAVPVPSCPAALAEQWIDLDAMQTVSRGVVNGYSLSPLVTKSLSSAIEESSKLQRKKILSKKRAKSAKRISTMAKTTTTESTPAVTATTQPADAVTNTIPAIVAKTPDDKPNPEDDIDPSELMREACRAGMHKYVDMMADGTMDEKEFHGAIKEMMGTYAKHNEAATDDDPPSGDDTDTDDSDEESKAFYAAVDARVKEALEPIVAKQVELESALETLTELAIPEAAAA